MRRAKGIYSLFSDCEKYTKSEMEPIHKFNNKKNEEVVISKPKAVAKTQRSETSFCDNESPISLSFSHQIFDEIPERNSTYVNQQSYDEYADDLDYYVEPFEKEADKEESLGKQKEPTGDDLNKQISGEKEPVEVPDFIKDQTPKNPDLIEPKPTPLPVQPEPPKRMPVMPDDAKEIPMNDQQFESDFQEIMKRKKDYENFQEKVDPNAANEKKRQQNVSNAKSFNDPYYTGEHGIFEKIAQNMTLANSYDLGAISLEQRFDSFEKDMRDEDTSDRKVVKKAPLDFSNKGENIKDLRKDKTYRSNVKDESDYRNNGGRIKDLRKDNSNKNTQLVPPVRTDDFLDDLDIMSFSNNFEEEIPTSLSVPKPSLATIRTRIDQYLSDANHTYKLPSGAEVSAKPIFKYGRGMTSDLLDARKKKFRDRLSSSVYEKLKMKIVYSLYGRSKPSEVREVTQALIDTGAPLTSNDSDGIRKLQNEYNIGIDCAGYVQLAFFNSIHGHDNDQVNLRRQLGFEDKRGSERLYHLKNNKYTTLPFTSAQTGDLMILNPRKGEKEIHTVIVADHTSSGAKHKFTVDASWGNDAYGFEAGGVGRRIFCYDDNTKKWSDIDPNTGAIVNENPDGPYKGHPIKGVYRIK